MTCPRATDCGAHGRDGRDLGIERRPNQGEALQFTVTGDRDARLRGYEDSVRDFDLHFTSWHQHVTKPVITAVNGICAGGGLHWVADADIVIAASNAQFFDPHVSVGQVVAVEAIGLLRKMPAEAVMRMALVGRWERMPATRALELGMISQIVDPPERLREEAQTA